MTPLRSPSPWASPLLAAMLALAGCAGTPAPPMQYYQLRLEAPPESPRRAVAEAAVAEVWQLMQPIRLPEYLERETLWVTVGHNGLQPLDGHRWAEPLRSAVPRILGHDLGALHGAASVWNGPLPAGLVAARQWRVELLEFAPSADRQRVRLRARFSATDPSGRAPRVGEAEISAPSAGPRPDQLVDAYRLALWRLAERMVASTAGPSL